MTSSIKIRGDVVTINPLLIFQRISLNLKNQEDMKKYLQYELAPFPLSLFDENGMRKTSKSSFYHNFECLPQRPVINANDILFLTAAVCCTVLFGNATSLSKKLLINMFDTYNNIRKQQKYLMDIPRIQAVYIRVYIRLNSALFDYIHTITSLRRLYLQSEYID